MSTAAGTAAPVRRHVEHVMGMPISLAVRGRHAGDERGAAAWADAVAVLREADRVFSTYRPDSVISLLCGGDLSLSACPPEVAAQVREVLALGDAAARDSGGAFALRRDGILDPSGVVKGWAAERAATHLATLPDTDFCLTAGGDITCRTLDPSAAPWRIGIEDPRDPRRLVAVMPVHTGAVATSGAAHRGAHITDARTGRPPLCVASVTSTSTRRPPTPLVRTPRAGSPAAVTAPHSSCTPMAPPPRSPEWKADGRKDGR